MKIGIIGYGSISRTHIKLIKENSELELVAVLDKENKEREVKKEVGEKIKFHTLNTLNDFLDEVEAVVITTPPYLHSMQAIQALQAGKHVLVEKPMATKLEDAIRMGEVAREVRKVLMPTAHMKYHPKIQSAVEKRKKGYFGKIIKAEANILSNIHAYITNDWVFDKEKSGGGTIMDDGVNAFDCLLEVLGEKIKVIGVRKLGYADIHGNKRNVETEAEIKFVFGKNMPGIIRLKWNQEKEEIYMLLISNKEKYKIDLKKSAEMGDFTELDYAGVYKNFLHRIRESIWFDERDLDSLRLVMQAYDFLNKITSKIENAREKNKNKNSFDKSSSKH